MNKKQKIIEAYWDEYENLQRIAVGILRDPDKALDVMQDLALMILEGRYADTNPGSIKAYLRTSTRHGCIDYLRKEKYNLYTDDVQALADRLEPIEDAEYKRIEIKGWLSSYLKSFSPELREAFAMHIIDGYTIEDVARQMGISSATLRQRFKRMRASLPVNVQLFIMLFLLIS